MKRTYISPVIKADAILQMDILLASPSPTPTPGQIPVGGRLDGSEGDAPMRRF